jgi:hypothetical protein
LPSEILEKLAQTILTEGAKRSKSHLLKSEGEKHFVQAQVFECFRNQRFRNF